MSAVTLAFLGVVLAIIYGKRRDLAHVWETVTPPLWLGVLFGFLAALGQVFGVLLARPVMAADVDPVLMLPFIWFRTGVMPAWGAWIGAVLIVACSAVLVL